MRRPFIVLLGLLTVGGATQGIRVQAAPRTVSTANHALPAAELPPVVMREIDPWPAIIHSRLASLPPMARAAAPALVEPTTSLQSELAHDLARLGQRIGKAAKIGVHVRDLHSGASLLDAQGDLALNPASNQKLLTSIAALELLGPDHRFETRIMLDGDDLVIVGEGDPSLQSEHLAQLAQAVKDGIDTRSIRRIVIDDGMFDAERFAPGYDDDGTGYSYLAPSGALSVQWNTVEITAVADKGEVKVFLDPPCAHVRVVNDAKVGRRSDLRVETTADGDDTLVRVHGKVGRRAGVETIRRRVADPGRFAGSVFATALDLGDLPLVRGRASADAITIAEHHSAPLLEVLQSALKFSNNFTTEQVLRTLGHRMTGMPGSWQNGTLAVRRFWKQIGGDDAALVFENASGYSRRGRFSARGLVDLLAWSLRTGSRSAGLSSALAVSGTDGTLRDRLQDAPGRVFAKTGTLAGASALSGIVVDSSGAPSIAFSVLVNGPVTGHAAHALQDRVVRMLLEHA